MTTKTASQRGSLFNALRSLADEIKEEKTAAAQTKSAAPTPPDPGGYQGPSTHPTKDVDNRVDEATEGARSSENTADNKEDQPVGVDQEPEAKPGQDEQDQQQLNIGTQQSATGEQPSVEDGYKGDKDDPGTSHPAKTEDGEKYSSFKEAHSIAVGLANEILADLANGFGNQLTVKAAMSDCPKCGKDNCVKDGKCTKCGYDCSMKAAADQSDAAADTSTESGKDHSSDPKSRPETSAPMTPAGGSSEGEHVEPGGGENKSAGIDPARLKAAEAAIKEGADPKNASEEIQAGYELAAAMGLQKEAAIQAVQSTLAETIKDAQLDADLFGSYYTTLADGLYKQAVGGAEDIGGEEGEDHSSPGDEASGTSEAPPDNGGGEGEMGGLGDLLGGGGGAPEMGGDAAGMGEPTQEEAIAELAAALDELGIPLEALVESGGMGGGEMGGMGGMGGGMMPPPEGPPAGATGMEVAASAKAAARTELQKLASAVRQFKNTGKYQLKAAQTPRQRQLRNVMRDYVQELVAATN